MRYKYWFLVLLPLLWLGCDDEDKIVTGEELELTYTLPQGDHDYDDQIVEWYEKYGFYTLYIYDMKDIFWSNENWDERVENDNGGYKKGKQADPDHAGKLVELFKYAFMDVYPDSLLTRYMPQKVMLCSELWDTYWDVTFDWVTGERIRTLMYDKLWAYQGWDNIAINGGSQEIDTMGIFSKMEFQYAVNTLFINRLYEKKKMEMPEEFTRVSDYFGPYISEYEWDRIFGAGFLLYGLSSPDLKNPAVCHKRDFESFLRLVGMPIGLLEASPDRRYDEDYSGQHPVSLIGALHPERDSQGLIRKKYEIMIRVLKEIGIDTERLQYPDYK